MPSTKQAHALTRTQPHTYKAHICHIQRHTHSHARSHIRGYVHARICIRILQNRQNSPATTSLCLLAAQIIGTTSADFVDFADRLQRISEHGSIAVVGSETALAEANAALAEEARLQIRQVLGS